MLHTGHVSTGRAASGREQEQTSFLGQLDQLWPELRDEWRVNRRRVGWYVAGMLVLLLVAGVVLSLGVFREMAVEERPRRSALGTGPVAVALFFGVGLYLVGLSWAGSSAHRHPATSNASSTRKATPENERARRLRIELESLRRQLKDIQVSSRTRQDEEGRWSRGAAHRARRRCSPTASGTASSRTDRPFAGAWLQT